MKKWLTVILVLLLVILQYQLWQGNDSLLQVVRLYNAIEDQQADILKLTQRNQALEAEVQLLKTKPQALEERARTELGMIKQGETFCLVIEPAR